MISPEKRLSKPYAVPIKMIPCRGPSDEKMRHFTSAIRAAMADLKMDVCGLIASQSVSLHV